MRYLLSGGTGAGAVATAGAGVLRRALFGASRGVRGLWPIVPEIFIATRGRQVHDLRSDEHHGALSPCANHSREHHGLLLGVRFVLRRDFVPMELQKRDRVPFLHPEGQFGEVKLGLSASTFSCGCQLGPANLAARISRPPGSPAWA